MYKRLNITLPDDVLARADGFAASRRWTRSGLIAAALEAFVGEASDGLGDGDTGEGLVGRETSATYAPPVAAPVAVGGLSLEAAAPALRAFFAARDDVAAAWVFGSVAGDAAGPLSDVDVAVLTEGGVVGADARLALSLDLAARIGSALRVPLVDVVVLEDAPVVLAHRIVTRGVCVHGAERLETAEAVVRAVTAYWDFQPILREGDRRVEEWVDRRAGDR